MLENKLMAYVLLTTWSCVILRHTVNIKVNLFYEKNNWKIQPSQNPTDCFFWLFLLSNFYSHAGCPSKFFQALQSRGPRISVVAVVQSTLIRQDGWKIWTGVSPSGVTPYHCDQLQCNIRGKFSWNSLYSCCPACTHFFPKSLSVTSLPPFSLRRLSWLCFIV